jgi:hypothetical protein
MAKNCLFEGLNEGNNDSLDTCGGIYIFFNFKYKGTKNLDLQSRPDPKGPSQCEIGLNISRIMLQQ